MTTENYGDWWQSLLEVVAFASSVGLEFKWPAVVKESWMWNWKSKNELESTKHWKSCLSLLSPTSMIWVTGTPTHMVQETRRSWKRISSRYGRAAGQGAALPWKGERGNRCVWTAKVPDALTNFRSVETAVALLAFSNLILSFSGAHSNLEPYREGDSANVVAAPL